MRRRSDKITVTNRLNEIQRLLLAGAEFHDIQQIAITQNWQVSNRQIRRYIRAAYKRFERASKRERSQLFGRHIAQRRALYAKAIKAGDLRSALQIVRDEASLEGLYPRADAPCVLDEKPKPIPAGPEAVAARRKRLVKMLNAEAKGELDARDRIEREAPKKYYTLPDTSMPNTMLQLMSLMYLTEQLDYVGQYFRFLMTSMFEETSEYNQLHDFAQIAAYQYRVNRDGWEQFATDIGIDSAALLAGNYRGMMIDMCDASLRALAPTTEEACEILQRSYDLDAAPEKLKTPETHAQSWHNLLTQILRQ